MKKTLPLLSLLFILSCGGYGDGGGDSTEATLSSIQTNIFTPTCATAGCHSAASASGGLVLTDGGSFANLVDVDSTESFLKRVLTNDPDNSYLIHKVEGTQGLAGGSGGRMPLNGFALTTEEIQAIRDWITAGAEEN